MSKRFSSRIDVWQLSVICLATKSVIDLVFQFSSLQEFGITVVTRKDPSVRTWKTNWNTDFGAKVLQRARIWNWKITTRQIPNHDFYNVLDFQSKHLQRVRFWFKKIYNVSDLQLKIFQSVRYWISSLKFVSFWTKNFT